MHRIGKSLLLAVVASGVLAIGTASAQSGSAVADPGHPRVNEVTGREQHLQSRIDTGISQGTINPNEAARLQRTDNRIEARTTADLAKNGGHLTAAETRRLNRSENRLSGRVYHARHDAN